jgi:hypothetical protein
MPNDRWTKADLVVGYGVCVWIAVACIARFIDSGYAWLSTMDLADDLTNIVLGVFVARHRRWGFVALLVICALGAVLYTAWLIKHWSKASGDWRIWSTSLSGWFLAWFCGTRWLQTRRTAQQPEQ